MLFRILASSGEQLWFSQQHDFCEKDRFRSARSFGNRQSQQRGSARRPSNNRSLNFRQFSVITHLTHNKYIFAQWRPDKASKKLQVVCATAGALQHSSRQRCVLFRLLPLSRFNLAIYVFALFDFNTPHRSSRSTLKAHTFFFAHVSISQLQLLQHAISPRFVAPFCFFLYKLSNQVVAMISRYLILYGFLRFKTSFALL